MSSYIESSSKFREYIKLFFVFLFLAGVATLMSTSVEFTLVGWLDWFIGTYLIIFGAFKMIHYEAFMREFKRYDIFASKNKVYNLGYPFLEIILGFFYVTNFAPLITYVVTLVLASVGFLSVMRNLMIRGASVYATTLGKIVRLPLSTELLITNAIMFFLSITMILLLVLY